jgi:hypothetical protein
VPGDHKRTGPAAIPSPSQAEPAPTSTRDSLSHCPDCRCRCGCHRPPEPPIPYCPPRPGSTEWSGYLAGLSADLGSLVAAYAAVETGDTTA